MKHTPEDFLKELLNDEGIQYALFNSGKLLFDASTSLSNMLLTSPDGAILGKKIDDLFPELLGYEGSLSEIQDGSLTELIIERIHRTELWSQEGYVTLKS